MKKLLMCRPDYFNVNYVINPWMEGNNNKVDVALAQFQWQKLYDALSKHTTILLVNPVKHLPDMVFTANAGFYHKRNKMIYLSHFSKYERWPEEEYFFKWFRDIGYSVFQPNCDFEGEGDLLKGDHGHFWLGHGFRTTKKIKHVFPFDQIDGLRTLTMIDPRFYHLDTCFVPLNKEGGILWYPGAFSQDSQEKVRKHTPAKYRVEVTEQEALTFCCNAVILGNQIFMPQSETVAEKLSRLGFKVHQFDMSEFMKSGGACKCLVMYLD